MSTLNFQCNAVAYSDIKTSNNPSLRTFDLGFKLLGVSVQKPQSEELSLAPGETKSVFDGVRQTSIDGTTSFDITKPDPTQNVYRIAHNAGTAPAFRTARALGLDNTSVIAVTVNGPIATYTNTGGTAINTAAVVVGDTLKIESGAGFSTANIGKFVVLSKTSTSITVTNLNAAAESVTLLDFAKFMIFDVGASNKPQVKDKLIISSGFSQATFGTYEITEVTPSYVEILSASPNGLPLETGVIPTASGFVIYSSAKKFILVSAQQKASIRVNGDATDNVLVEPIETNNPEKAGLMIKHGTVYSLSIKNLGLETLNVLVASAE